MAQRTSLTGLEPLAAAAASGRIDRRSFMQGALALPTGHDVARTKREKQPNGQAQASAARRAAA